MSVEAVPRRRGRPPSGHAYQPVRFQLAADDLARIDRAAEEHGLTRSDVVRWCLRRGMRQLSELPARRPTPYGVEAAPGDVTVTSPGTYRGEKAG